MSIGARLLDFKQKYQHGVTVAYYRDTIRPRILRAKPQHGIGDDPSVEIHVLTSQQDLLNLMWTLYSFYFSSGTYYKLCIHDDGSLNNQAIDILSCHFPGARIIPSAIAEPAVLDWLADFPRCQLIRKLKFISAKEFDFVYYQSAPKCLLFDSDLLFFRKPEFLIDCARSADYKFNLFNRDLQSAFSLSVEQLQQYYGISVLDRYNSGLGLTQADSIRRDWVEEFLSVPAVLNHPWRFEQTLHALCSCRFGAELLPPEYDVFLQGDLLQRPVRHYVGAIRHLMYSEGMRILYNSPFATAISI